MRIPKTALPRVATCFSVGYHASSAQVFGLEDWRSGIKPSRSHYRQSPIAALKAPRKHKATMFKSMAALTLLFIPLVLLPAPIAQAAPRCFPEAAPAISACIDGRIAEFWARNG